MFSIRAILGVLWSARIALLALYLMGLAAGGIAGTALAQSGEDAAAECDEAWALTERDGAASALEQFLVYFAHCKQAAAAQARLDVLTGSPSGEGVRGGPRPAPGQAFAAGSVGARPADAPSLPSFGPYPEWSSRSVMTQGVRAAFLRPLGSVQPDLRKVGDRLATVMQQSGYSDYGFYKVDGGFALVARLEKFRDDGTPDPDGRYFSPTERQPFGFGGFLASLIYGPQGYYRVIVFVVTDQMIMPSGGPPTVKAADAWFVRAADRLPAGYAELPFSAEHQVSALIYEFRKGAEGSATSIVPAKRLSSEQHLRGAGLYQRLWTGAPR